MRVVCAPRRSWSRHEPLALLAEFEDDFDDDDDS
jgi:hypothetical protein